MSSSVASLVEQAVQCGARLHVENGKIVCTPRGALPPTLRRRLAERKSEVMQWLLGRSDDTCPRTCPTPTCETSDTQDRGNSAGSAGAVEATSKHIATVPAPLTLDARARRAPCFACGSSAYWALAQVGHWVCAGCHEPDGSPDTVVWMHVRPPKSAFGPGRPDRSCACCRGSGVERLSSGGWTVCSCRERDFAPEQPDDGNGGVS